MRPRCIKYLPDAGPELIEKAAKLEELMRVAQSAHESASWLEVEIEIEIETRWTTEQRRAAVDACRAAGLFAE